MPSATFDTHAAVKRLSDAGLDISQAEAITDTLREAVSEEVATKADLRAEIAALEARLTVRMYAIALFVVLGNAALTVALLKLL